MSDRPVIDPAMPKNIPCHLAVECAMGIANYCLTRFPCDTPPHPMLDVPWFAEKVQRCIDEATTIGLKMRCERDAERARCAAIARRWIEDYTARLIVDAIESGEQP